MVDSEAPAICGMQGVWYVDVRSMKLKGFNCTWYRFREGLEAFKFWKIPKELEAKANEIN
jgi:hypothetical protein